MAVGVIPLMLLVLLTGLPVLVEPVAAALRWLSPGV
jgi:hypothetical protein